MSLAVLHSRALNGMLVSEVAVEVHLTNWLPSFKIVGLPETEVKESKDRVRATLQTAKFEFPVKHITVNLAPADLPKESGRNDLPIALGLLAASGQISSKHLDDYVFACELALTGELRPIHGALAMTASVVQNDAKNVTPPNIENQSSEIKRGFIMPKKSASEAALVQYAIVYPAESQLAVCAHLFDREQLQPITHTTMADTPIGYQDFQDVKGLSQPKRALKIAAAGGNNILLSGPPGIGKSMLASRFTGIFPTTTDQEALESAAIQSLNGGYC